MWFSLSRKEWKVLFLICTIYMVLSPIAVTAQADVPGFEKSGPYIDRLVYDLAADPVLDLISGEIDMTGNHIDPSFIPQFEEADNIAIHHMERNGYGYITINTAKYPLNITAFRRALAFALDKEAISDDVWDGLSYPQDSPVPDVNPFSTEGQLPYTYYEANVPLGNQLLDDAGFLPLFEDLDPGEFRRAPDGSEFDIVVECAASAPIAIEVGALVAEALQALGINAVSQPTDFYEYLNRLNYHGDYDICFLGLMFSHYDVDWLGYNFWSEYADEPYWNFASFRNASFDSWREPLLHSLTFDEVYEAAIEMQKILVYECPWIVCYSNVEVGAYRTDRFEGHVFDRALGIWSEWTERKVHLKADQGGPFGGTFKISNARFESLNFMVTSTIYAAKVHRNLYDSLLIRAPDGLDMFWLAESYLIETHEDNEDIPQGHTRLAFDMIQNVTWSDGCPLTAEDVAFSLNYYRDAPGCSEGFDLSEMTAAYAPTRYQVVIEFHTESYWHLHNIAFKYILPKHIFTEIGLENWNTWNPRPPTETMVTSGQFNISEFIEGEFVELTHNPNYFYGLDRSTQTSASPTPSPTDPGDLVLSIVAGAVGAAVVILVGGFVLLREK
jgi:ABC-type transport system substrate-binding protein